MLEYIITSKTRRLVLELLYHHPTESFYLRDIVRRTGEEVNAVKRELDLLTAGHILTREERLNKVFFGVNKNWQLFDEFCRIFAKSLPLVRSLRANIAKLGKISGIALSMKFVKKQNIRPDEIYLLVVGTTVVPEVAAIVAQYEEEFGREINYTVMTEEELAFRKRNNDPFIWRFLKLPKIMVAGSEEELVK